MEAIWMPNLSVKNAPPELVAALKDRARRNHRSLQGEVLATLEDSVRQPGRLTPLQLLAEVEKLNFKTPSESAEIVRKMRDERYGG
jgi:plasmid stability protein